MKSLQEHIKSVTLPKSVGYRTFDEFLDINNITDDMITDDVIETYMKTSNSNIFGKNVKEIIETLSKSHDHKKLINKLKSDFNNKFYDFTEYNSDSSIKSFFFSLRSSNVDLLSSNKFVHYIEFFNYTVSEIKQYENSELVVYMEPSYSENITNYVYNKCNSTLYHVTRTTNYNRIMRRGLQLKEGNDYRNFLPRIYVSFGENNDIVKNNIEHTIDQLGYKNYIILKIDLSKYNIDIYKDASSDNKYDGYIYAYIPPKFITKIDIDEL